MSPLPGYQEKCCLGQKYTCFCVFCVPWAWVCMFCILWTGVCMFLCVLDMGMHVLSARLLTSFMNTPEHGMTGLNVLPHCSPHTVVHSWHRQPCRRLSSPSTTILSVFLWLLLFGTSAAQVWVPLTAALPGVPKHQSPPGYPTCLSPPVAYPQAMLGCKALVEPSSALSPPGEARGAQAESFSDIATPGPGLPRCRGRPISAGTLGVTPCYPPVLC